MENENAVVFDAERIVALKLNTPGGVKTVRVRFPTDEEWTQRQRRRKVIIKNLGRGMSETTAPNGEDVDAALLAKIRAEEESPVEVDPFEAGRMIEQLSIAEIDDVVPVGGSFRVTLRVLGGTVTHLLKMPTAKQATEYKRGFARLIDLPFGKQELTINLGAAAALYRSLCETAEGYLGPVPIIHQAAAVRAAVEALDAAFEEDVEANF